LSGGHSGRESVEDTGRIEGTGGTAVGFGAARDRARRQRGGESEIFGDVLFGGSDDARHVFDIFSGPRVAGGPFDGGAGTDTPGVAASHAAPEFTAFDGFDTGRARLTVTAEGGQSPRASPRGSRSSAPRGRVPSCATPSRPRRRGR
jgi:hypothetical protein